MARNPYTLYGYLFHIIRKIVNCNQNQNSKHYIQIFFFFNNFTALGSSLYIQKSKQTTEVNIVMIKEYIITTGHDLAQNTGP